MPAAEEDVALAHALFVSLLPADAVVTVALPPVLAASAAPARNVSTVSSPPRFSSGRGLAAATPQ